VKRKLVFLFTSILLVLALSACGVSISSGKGHSTYTKDHNINEATGFKVKSGIKKVNFTLDIKNKEGNFSWEVTNSKNEIVWDGSLKGKESFKETKAFPATEGNFSLTIKTETAAGSYDFKWSD